MSGWSKKVLRESNARAGRFSKTSDEACIEPSQSHGFWIFCGKKSTFYENNEPNAK